MWLWLSLNISEAQNYPRSLCSKYVKWFNGSPLFISVQIFIFSWFFLYIEKIKLVKDVQIFGNNRMDEFRTQSWYVGSLMN